MRRQGLHSLFFSFCLVKNIFALTKITEKQNTVNSFSNSNSDLLSILEMRVEELFEKSETLPLSMSREKGNIEVRTKWEGDKMITVAQAKLIENMEPSEFKPFFENFAEAFPKVNPMCRDIQYLESDTEQDREGIKSILKFPFPLDNRIMVHWKYLIMDRNPDEHMLILSEEGNKDILSKHFTDEEKKKYVLARTFLCAYLVKPFIVDGKTIGSSIQYVFSGDVGGSLPQWIQNAVGPQTAFDSVKGLIDFAKRGTKNALR